MDINISAILGLRDEKRGRQRAQCVRFLRDLMDFRFAQMFRALSKDRRAIIIRPGSFGTTHQREHSNCIVLTCPPYLPHSPATIGCVSSAYALRAYKEQDRRGMLVIYMREVRKLKRANGTSTREMGGGGASRMKLLNHSCVTSALLGKHPQRKF